MSRRLAYEGRFDYLMPHNRTCPDSSEPTFQSVGKALLLQCGADLRGVGVGGLQSGSSQLAASLLGLDLQLGADRLERRGALDRLLGCHGGHLRIGLHRGDRNSD